MLPARRGVEIEGFVLRPEGSLEPERPPQVIGPRGRASHRDPLLVNGERLVCVNQDIAISLIGARELEAHLLVPTMHSADGIGLGSKGEVLVNSGILPPDPLRIRVF